MRPYLSTLSKILGFALCMTATHRAAADPVTLAFNGAATITAEFIMLQDGIYHLDSPLGRMYIPARHTTCEGAICPSPDQIAAHLQEVGAISDALNAH